MSKDILLYETGSGGDFSIQGNDIQLSETLFQNIYISLFGGNIEASTTGSEIEGEVRSDYWGNQLFQANSKPKQFNSVTESLLSNVVLNSGGRLSIQRAVEQDLEHLSNIVQFSVAVNIVSTHKVQIVINTTALANQQQKSYQLIYDNAKNEVITDFNI